MLVFPSKLVAQAYYMNQGSRYQLESRVYIINGRSLDGPYLVSSVPNPKTYTLCELDGKTAVQNGKVFAETELKKG
jgi:hypothetical protein